MGLLHITYTALDREHRLAEKFGIASPELLGEIAKKLDRGYRPSISCVRVSGARPPHPGQEASSGEPPGDPSRRVGSRPARIDGRLWHSPGRARRPRRVGRNGALVPGPLRHLPAYLRGRRDAARRGRRGAGHLPVPRQLSQGRAACLKTVDAARRVEASVGKEGRHPCFTGAEYRIFPIDYDSRRHRRKRCWGRSSRRRLRACRRRSWKSKCRDERGGGADLLPRMPRAEAETVPRLILRAPEAHVRSHLVQRSQVASDLADQHLSSVRESYRGSFPTRTRTAGSASTV